MNEILYSACIQLEAVQSASHSKDSEKKVNYCVRSPNACRNKSRSQTEMLLSVAYFRSIEGHSNELPMR